MKLTEENKNEIRCLLIGRKVTKVSENTLTLDDGHTLVLSGNEGCGGCASGWYELTELNGVDNKITWVSFEDNPDYERDDGSDGSYRIFVLADNTRINLATFEGSDGNGYYGTGYSIQVSGGISA